MNWDGLHTIMSALISVLLCAWINEVIFCKACLRRIEDLTDAREYLQRRLEEREL